MNSEGALQQPFPNLRPRALALPAPDGDRGEGDPEG